VSALLLGIFYVSMAGAALAIEFLFGALHLIPHGRKTQIIEESIRWNYTSILDLVFLVLGLLLVIRFLRTGGPAMLRMMSDSGEASDANHEHRAA